MRSNRQCQYNGRMSIGCPWRTPSSRLARVPEESGASFHIRTPYRRGYLDRLLSRNAGSSVATLSTNWVLVHYKPSPRLHLISQQLHSNFPSIHMIIYALLSLDSSSLIRWYQQVDYYILTLPGVQYPSYDISGLSLTLTRTSLIPKSTNCSYSKVTNHHSGPIGFIELSFSSFWRPTTYSADKYRDRGSERVLGGIQL